MAKKRATKPLYLEPMESKGRLVQGIELKLLLEQNVNYRLTYIREELNAMYPGEYDIIPAADKGGLTDQGLRDIEIDPPNSKRKKKVLQAPRDSTLTNIATAYNVPRWLFEQDCIVNELKGFFLGKVEDENAYFDDFYITYRQMHKLDKRGPLHFNNRRGEEYTYVNPLGYVEYEWDVVDIGNGQVEIDRITVEIIMRVIQTSTDMTMWEKRVGNKRVLLPADREYLDEALNNALSSLAERFEKLSSI